MDKTVSIHTKTTLSKLVEEVEAGGEIVLARRGKPVAKLVPMKPERKTKPVPKTKSKSKKPPKIDRRPGFMKGQIKILKGFYDPLPDDIMKAFLGEAD